MNYLKLYYTFLNETENKKAPTLKNGYIFWDYFFYTIKNRFFSSSSAKFINWHLLDYGNRFYNYRTEHILPELKASKHWILEDDISVINRVGAKLTHDERRYIYQYGLSEKKPLLLSYEYDSKYVPDNLIYFNATTTRISYNDFLTGDDDIKWTPEQKMSIQGKLNLLCKLNGFSYKSYFEGKYGDIKTEYTDQEHTSGKAKHYDFTGKEIDLNKYNNEFDGVREIFNVEKQGDHFNIKYKVIYKLTKEVVIEQDAEYKIPDSNLFELEFKDTILNTIDDLFTKVAKEFNKIDFETQFQDKIAQILYSVINDVLSSDNPFDNLKLIRSYSTQLEPLIDKALNNPELSKYITDESLSNYLNYIKKSKQKSIIFFLIRKEQPLIWNKFLQLDNPERLEALADLGEED